MAKIYAPWSPGIVSALLHWQARGDVHEFTCGTEGCRAQLIPTENGWTCPSCDYTQDWAHDFMCGVNKENPEGPTIAEALSGSAARAFVEEQLAPCPATTNSGPCTCADARHVVNKPDELTRQKRPPEMPAGPAWPAGHFAGSTGGIGHFLAENSKHCPKCGAPPSQQHVRNYDEIWRDGDVVCNLCGTKVRDYDAG